MWGSWWDGHEGKWGYACCHALLRHCICVGDAGRSIKEELERERGKREVKDDGAGDEQRHGEKRRREADDAKKPATAPPSSSSAPYNRYAREPTEAEMNDFHRKQRRMDDPLDRLTDTT